MLTLPIKKKWFDMILSGEKNEEYREIKAYWTNRLLKCDIKFDTEKIIELLKLGYCTIFKTVQLRNGYGNNRPTITCEVKIKIGYGKKEWGAEPGKEYYILEILDFKDEMNCSYDYYKCKYGEEEK